MSRDLRCRRRTSSHHRPTTSGRLQNDESCLCMQLTVESHLPVTGLPSPPISLVLASIWGSDGTGYLSHFCGWPGEEVPWFSQRAEIRTLGPPRLTVDSGSTLMIVADLRGIRDSGASPPPLSPSTLHGQGAAFMRWYLFFSWVYAFGCGKFRK